MKKVFKVITTVATVLTAGVGGYEIGVRFGKGRGIVKVMSDLSSKFKKGGK